jgi:protein O-mannosyl-transferase
MEKSAGKIFYRLLVLAMMIAAGFLVYFHGLKGEPAFDDMHTLVHNQAIRSLDPITFFKDPGAFSAKAGNWPYRPVVVLSYALDWKLGKGNFRMHHVTNILLHSLVGFFIYLVCGALFSKSRAGVIAGFLFIVHPLPGFSACYPSARSGILCALFLLISWFFFIGQSGKTATLNKSVRLGCSLFFFLLALLSKIDALSFVFVILCMLVFSKAGRKEKLISGLTFVILAVAFAIFYKIISGSLTGAIQSSMLPFYSRTQSVIAGLCSPWIYLFKLVWPRHLTIFPAMPRPLWLMLALSMFGYCALLVMALRNRKPGTWLPLVWYFAALLPASLMRLNILFSYHRAYIAMAGIFIGLGLLADTVISKHNKPAVALIVAAGILLAAVSHHQSRIWQDPVRLWSLAVEGAPAEFAPHHYLGTVLLESGDLSGAEKELKAAIRLQPEFTDAHNSLAAVYYKRGDLDAARAEFEKVLAADPENFVYLKNLVIVRLKSGDLDGLEPLVQKLREQAAPDDREVAEMVRDYQRRKQELELKNNGPK